MSRGEQPVSQRARVRREAPQCTRRHSEHCAVCAKRMSGLVRWPPGVLGVVLRPPAIALCGIGDRLALFDGMRAHAAVPADPELPVLTVESFEVLSLVVRAAAQDDPGAARVEETAARNI